MNGTILPYAMRTPLITPQAMPTPIAVVAITIQPTSPAIAWVPVVDAHTEDRATIAPTERSMPPPVITNVMPIATTPIADARLSMVMMLLVLAKRSPAVTSPTTQSSTSATTRPRLRATPSERARFCGAAVVG